MASITTAKSQARMIGQAINGHSSGVQTLGNMGRDPHLERLLAVGLAHAQNTISALIGVAEELEDEIEDLKRGRR